MMASHPPSTSSASSDWPDACILLEQSLRVLSVREGEVWGSISSFLFLQLPRPIQLLALNPAHTADIEI